MDTAGQAYDDCNNFTSRFFLTSGFRGRGNYQANLECGYKLAFQYWIMQMMGDASGVTLVKKTQEMSNPTILPLPQNN